MPKDWKKGAWLLAIFVGCFYLPLGHPRFDGALMEALALLKWYAREHVVLCLIPALFIAGAIATFVQQSAVMKYLGADARKVTAYGVASISGSVLAVCSCTVLPLFAGIYRMGAGLGPASAFLYSGPAINVMAIILTARVLGLQLGIARAVGAVVFSVVIGLLMHVLCREKQTPTPPAMAQVDDDEGRPLWQNATLLALMVATLVFATWPKPASEAGFWAAVHGAHWLLTAVAAAALGLAITRWLGVPWWKMLLAAVAPAVLAFVLPQHPLAAFVSGVIGLALAIGSTKGEPRGWLDESWSFGMQILPLLLGGVFVAGLLLGRPEGEGLIPGEWVAALVGGNSLWANLGASVVGAFMYFATLTEIPILEGLMGCGMGKGPALALLLSGPALSLPNMLVIRTVLGTRRTLLYVTLVVIMSTLSGMIFGAVAN